MHARLRRPAVALITTTLAASVLGIAPAADAIVATGSIAGTITSAGVAVSDDVRVVVYDATDPEAGAEEAVPDSEGDYVVEGLAPGTYDVTFQSPTGTYVYEAWEDASDFEDATPVDVEDAPVTGIDADLALAGQVSGTVLDESGDPILGAWVTVSAERPVVDGGSDWVAVGGGETLDDGSYEIDRLAAGTYKVDFYADGYLSEYYDDVPTLEGSEDVTVVGGDTTADIDADLTEDATVSGTVTDADDQPLVGAWVWAGPVGSDDGEWEQTDADGTYTIDGLPAGSYDVFFSFDVDEGDQLSEYYDNVGSVDEATHVPVVAGDDETGIDAKLVAGEHDPVLLPYLDNQSAPTITGTAQVGSTLTATAGTWSPAPTGVEYFWFAGDDYVHEGQTYVPTTADLGKRLTLLVAVSKDGYERTYAESAATGPVVAAPAPPVVTPPAPAPTPTPTVDVPTALTALVANLDVAGKPKVGSTVKVKGLDKLLRATGVSYTFQWYAGSAKIKKATTSKLKITRAMKGKKLSVKVTATAASTSKTVKLKVGKVA